MLYCSMVWTGVMPMYNVLNQNSWSDMESPTNESREGIASQKWEERREREREVRNGCMCLCMLLCSRAHSSSLQFFIPRVSVGVYNVYRCKIVLVSLNRFLLIECTLIKMWSLNCLCRRRVSVILFHPIIWLSCMIIHLLFCQMIKNFNVS